MFEKLKGKIMGKHKQDEIHFTQNNYGPEFSDPETARISQERMRAHHGVCDNSPASHETNWAGWATGRTDVFGKPKIAPQGQDGVGHLNYFDAERQLSFQWDGDYFQDVVVSHGGYGEPILWTFEFLKYYNLHRNWVLRRSALTWQSSSARPNLQDNFTAATVFFKDVCDFWIEYMEDANEDA